MRKLSFNLKLPGINLTLGINSGADSWVFFSTVCPRELLIHDQAYQRALAGATGLVTAGISFRVVQSPLSSGSVVTQIVMEWDKSAYDDLANRTVQPQDVIVQIGPSVEDD